MNNATHNAAGEHAEQRLARDVARRFNLPELVFHAIVLIALGLLVGAVVIRYRAAPEISVQWGARQGDERSGDDQSQALGAEEKDVRQSLLGDDDDALVSLGPQLDNARFGALEHKRRLDLERVIPIARRWQFSFSSGLTEGQYAEHLAALGMELGVLSADGKLQYVSGMGKGDVKLRTGDKKAERRPYWTWDAGDLKRADEVLLSNARVFAADKMVLHFLPPETIKKLETLEKEFQGRNPQDILRTRFALKRTFRGYELYVAEQIER